MKATPELFARFAGGQVEVQHPLLRYLYRGKAEKIEVDGGAIRVTFEWIAQGLGYPEAITHWVVDESRPFTWNGHLSIFSVCDIGEERLRLVPGTVGETVVFFPPGAKAQLSPSQVEGLGTPTCSTD